MIFIDASELREGSTMPTIEGAKTSDCLEAVAGADCMVSPLSFPASSETLIRKHVQGSAVLIQIKRGADLLSSITDERVNIALARMHSIGTRGAWQRIILTTGVLIPDLETGEVQLGVPQLSSTANTYVYTRLVNENLPKYQSYATLRWRIATRGGYFLPLTCDDEIPSTLYQMEKDLKWMVRKGEKELYHLESFPPDPPAQDDPLQLPIEVRDGRRVIAAFQGIGPAKATALWNTIRGWNHAHLPDRKPEPTLSQALFWASCANPKSYGLPKVPGWGKGMRAKVREQLGLEEGFSLRAMPDGYGEGTG